jgi:hypothetical protein
MPEKPSANALRCTKCKEGTLKEGYFDPKPKIAFIMKCTLIGWPFALLLMAKPDFYECQKCGHKKGSLWV